MNLKKDQKVKIICGDDKGKSGKILKMSKDKQYLWVEGINMKTRHTKPNKTLGFAGGLFKVEGKIHHSNVALTDYIENEKSKSVKIKKETVKRKTLASSSEKKND